MTLLHQAAQKAVEALTFARRSLAPYGGNSAPIEAALAALESALQQQPEPVATEEAAYQRGKRAGYIDGYRAAHADERQQPDISPALQHQEVPSDKQIARAFADEQMRQGSGTHNRHEWFRRGALWAASPSTTRQQEVGSGWKLVPVEPTREMIRAASVIRATMVNDGEWCVGIGGAIDAYEALLAAAPSTPEKAGGVSDAGVMASADGWVEAGLVCQACAGDAPGGKCRNPKCVGGPIVRELVPAEKDEPSPIPHPLPAQANDGGEHG